MSETRPDTFLVGAPRAGTTSLLHYVSDHPDVAASSVDEPRHFCSHHDWIRTHRPDEVVHDRDAYLSLFPETDADVVMEATTTYLWLPGTAERIHDFDPDARILVLLREPVARAHSHYWMNVRHGREDRPFPEAVDAQLASEEVGEYVTPGLYATHLERWLDVFPRDQVLVLRSADLFEDADATLGTALDFLDLPREAADPDTDAVHNPTRVPRGGPARSLLASDRLQAAARRLLPDALVTRLRDALLVASEDRPDPDPDAARRLAERYEPEVRRLEDLLEIDVAPLLREPEAGT